MIYYNQKFKVWENIPENVRLLAVFIIECHLFV